MRSRDVAICLGSWFTLHGTTLPNLPRGATVRKNFKSIVRQRAIRAIRPHCLHGHKIPEEHEDQFSVCCFTEVPLAELHLLARRIPGRKIQLSDFGFVFSRDFIISKGAQPAIYINSYNNDTWLREAADHIYKISKDHDFSEGKLSRFIPFLNAMNEGYDFTWEREWRVLGDLEFEPKDVVCIILPEEGERKWKHKFLTWGVPVISLGWSTERIISEFSEQARQARRTWMKRRSVKSANKNGRKSN